MADNTINSVRVARALSRFLCLVLLLSGFSARSAQNEDRRVRNIVLVHGAWADGSGWKGVYDILVKDGYKVSIVQEPELTTVTCPLHGSQFNVCTGEVLRGPATEALKTYRVIVDADIGRVEADDAAAAKSAP